SFENTSTTIATPISLFLNKAATGYTLQATSGTLTPVLSNPITVTPASAAQLQITSQPPGTVAAGSPFSVTAAVVDPSGNIDSTNASTSTIPVVLSLVNPPTGTTLLLGGTPVTSVTVNSSAGLAVFNGLSVNRPGTYTLSLTIATTILPGG